jgi:hypothetical protein
MFGIVIVKYKSMDETVSYINQELIRSRAHTARLASGWPKVLLWWLAPRNLIHVSIRVVVLYILVLPRRWG